MSDNLQSFLDATAGMSLVDKAFADVEHVCKFLEVEMPEDEKVIIRRACEVIDTHTSHSAHDKESVKAAAVLTLSTLMIGGMIYVFDDTKRFKPGYSERVHTIVNDFLEEKLSPDMAEIMMAMGVATSEDARRKLAGPGATAYVASLDPAEAFAPVEEQLEAFNEPEFQASPALLALLTKEITETCQLIAKFKPGAAPAPASPQP